MKKAYISPASASFNLAMEGAILTTSLSVSDEEITDTNQILSDKGGWNSSLWAEDGDEQ